MKKLTILKITALSTLCACMPQRQTQIQAPQNSVEYRKGTNQSRDRSVASEKQSSLLMSLPIASFEALKIDGDKLYYSLVYKDEQNKELASRAKTKVVIDPTTMKGVVDFKVPNPSSGYISMTIIEEGTANKFAGKSELLKVAGPTKVSLQLKKLNAGDANIEVEATFEEGAQGQADGEGTGNQNNDGPDVSKIENATLAALVKSVGDPAKWGTPTFDQIKPISDQFCAGCHIPGYNFGNSSIESFYKDKSFTNRMNDALMPSPNTDYAREMDELKEAGFDYRAAIKKFAVSLGNNK